MIGKQQTSKSPYIEKRSDIKDFDIAFGNTVRKSNISSLFMVKSREMGYINAKIKLVELLAKNRKARVSADYTFGIVGVE